MPVTDILSTGEEIWVSEMLGWFNAMKIFLDHICRQTTGNQTPEAVEGDTASTAAAPGGATTAGRAPPQGGATAPARRAPPPPYRAGQDRVSGRPPPPYRPPSGGATAPEKVFSIDMASMKMDPLPPIPGAEKDEDDEKAGEPQDDYGNFPCHEYQDVDKGPVPPKKF